MTAIPPLDDSAHLDNLLMAEVADVNNRLGRYMLRFLDADAGRAQPLGTEVERALADQVASVAETLHARADRRDHHGEPLRLLGPTVPETPDV